MGSSYTDSPGKVQGITKGFFAAKAASALVKKFRGLAPGTAQTSIIRRNCDGAKWSAECCPYLVKAANLCLYASYVLLDLEILSGFRKRFVYTWDGLILLLCKQTGSRNESTQNVKGTRKVTSGLAGSWPYRAGFNGFQVSGLTHTPLPTGEAVDSFLPVPSQCLCEHWS